jgi:guanosine-3',5'-bis(diphosphate) 3'-pyrophosphohydrolase
MDSIELPQYKGIPTVEEILAGVEIPINGGEEKMIRDAYGLARQLHEGQLRKSGDPYFMHCGQVALLLARLVNDPSTIAAGLLHDTIEDCGASLEDLKARFPDPVPDLVDGVTKISSLNYSSDLEHQADNLRKMILAMAKDVRVVLIKLCDRLHNMQTLQYLRPERQRAISQVTMDIYAPLANRLGMTRMRSLLEDLSMKYLSPVPYRQLESKMAGREARDQRIVDATRKLLGEQLEMHKINFEIQGRRKHLFSLHQKIKEQGLSLDEVHDILAVRIITDNMQDCYEILGIVHSIWKPIDGRFKDYIGAPKENGYRSIHTSVIGIEDEITEVQIRTREMHEIAEEGIAAHWKYKEKILERDVVSLNDEERRLSWLRQLVDWLTDVRDPSEFMMELKRDVFENSVFCYTPAGDIIELQQGATALDMAYRIHSDIGHHCSGARVNKRMVSIRRELQTGDIVEILTSKASHPTPDWLHFVNSGRARNKIRHWLKESQRDVFLERGRQKLVEQIKTRFGSKIDLDTALKSLSKHMNLYSVHNTDELLVEAGCGSIRTASLIQKLELEFTDHPINPPTTQRISRAVRRPQKLRERILVEGMSGAITRIARCCSPLPGDAIIGFITQGRGISIHKAECRSLNRNKDRIPDFERRLIHVDWGDSISSMKKAAIRLVCQDRKGLLGDITSAIAVLNVNIIDSNTHTIIRDNRAIIKLVMLVDSSDLLNTVLNRLSAVPGISSVSRVIHAR